MNPYPTELRTRIVATADQGVGSLPTVAALFGVSTNCVANYLLLRTATGSLQPRPNPGGRAPAIGPERYDEVRQLLAAQPDLTLQEVRDALGLGCSLAAVCRDAALSGAATSEQLRSNLGALRVAWDE